MNSPSNNKLPFIAYGSFKPGELRYNLIKDFVLQYEEIMIEGLIQTKDGIPILNRGRSFWFSYQAFKISFKDDCIEKAYNIICNHEPNSFYEWSEWEDNNVLIGKKGLKGLEEYWPESWSFRHDPYFKFGLMAVTDLVSLENTRVSDHYSDLDKDKFNLNQEYTGFFRFSQKMSSYLLLWTIVERFCTLKYGHIKPMQKITSLVEDKDLNWVDLLSHIDREDIIYRSQYSADKEVLKPPYSPKKTLSYYYAMRSNSTHMGKAADIDSIRIQNAIDELLIIFQKILEAHGYNIH